MFVNKAGATLVKHLLGRVGSWLYPQNYTKLERPAMDKRSCLFRTIIKSFGPGQAVDYTKEMNGLNITMRTDREYQRGMYHCTINLLFDWIGLVCFANKNKNSSCHTAGSKPLKQEGNGTLILPPLVFPGTTVFLVCLWVMERLG